MNRLLTSSDDPIAKMILGGKVNFQRYVFFGPTRPNIRAIIEWPGVLPVSGQRQARYVRFQPLGDVPWELAELELYTDGTTLPGFFPLGPASGQHRDAGVGTAAPRGGCAAGGIARCPADAHWPG